MERLWCEAIKREVIRRQAVRNVPVLTCRIFYFFEMEALFVPFFGKWGIMNLSMLRFRQ